MKQKKIFIAFLGLTLLNFAALAQSDTLEKVSEKTKEVTEKVDLATDKSVLARAKFKAGGQIHYSILDMILSGKYGASIYFSDDELSQYEVMFLKTEITAPGFLKDFGKVEEQRISLLKRNFSMTSNFNWYWGISYHSLQATLGNDLLNALAPGQNIPNIDLLTVKTLGLDIGLGHRWYFQNGVSISVDWLGYSQPLISLKREAPFTEAQLTNSSSKDTVDNALKVAAFLPRLQFLKLGLGYNF